MNSIRSTRSLTPAVVALPDHPSAAQWNRHRKRILAELPSGALKRAVGKVHGCNAAGYVPLQDYLATADHNIASAARLSADEVHALKRADQFYLRNDARIYMDVVYNVYTFVWFNHGERPPSMASDEHTTSSSTKTKQYTPMGATYWLSRTDERQRKLDALRGRRHSGSGGPGGARARDSCPHASRHRLLPPADQYQPVSQ